MNTSGAYGFEVKSALGMGYITNPEGKITNEWIKKGTYEIMVEGKPLPAKLHLSSPYDPKNLRTKM